MVILESMFKKFQKAFESSEQTDIRRMLANDATLTKVYCGESNEEIFKLIMDALSKNTRVKELNLSHLNLERMKLLIEVLKMNKTLLRINFSSSGLCYDGTESLRLFCEALKNNITPPEIYFSHEEFGDVGIQMLSEAMGRNNTLSSLIFGHCDLNAKDIKILGQILKVNKSLIRLVVDGFSGENECSVEAMKSLSEGLIASRLRVLCLRGCKIDSEQMAILSNVLKNHVTLTHLDLSLNDIGSIGVISFASVINSTRLTHVCLEGSKIDCEGAVSLGLALKTNVKLTHLDLSRNGIRLKGVEGLTKAFEENRVLTGLEYDRDNIGFFESDINHKMDELLKRNSPEYKLKERQAILSALLSIRGKVSEFDKKMIPILFDFVGCGEKNKETIDGKIKIDLPVIVEGVGEESKLAEKVDTGIRVHSVEDIHQIFPVSEKPKTAHETIIFLQKDYPGIICRLIEASSSSDGKMSVAKLEVTLSAKHRSDFDARMSLVRSSLRTESKKMSSFLS